MGADADAQEGRGKAIGNERAGAQVAAWADLGAEAEAEAEGEAVAEALR